MGVSATGYNLPRKGVSVGDVVQQASPHPFKLIWVTFSLSGAPPNMVTDGGNSRFDVIE